MRFKEKLAYSLTVDEEIDTNFIQIPPLLIQPYIENAIWHGLMHKAGGGHISVKIILYKNQTLIFTVEDNGIGRVKSAELKSKQEKNHNSLGTRLTAERIALINEKYMTNAVVAIDDLYDETLTPLGTRVTIQLTIK
jgi:sensor histidine kinase YesM